MPTSHFSFTRLFIFLGVGLSLLIILGGGWLLFQKPGMLKINQPGESAISSGTEPTPTAILSPSLKQQLPFDTAAFEQGVLIGSVKIPLSELISMYTVLNANVSQDLNSLADWQTAADAICRNATIINAAIDQGFMAQQESTSPAYSYDLYEQAITFLNTEYAKNGTTPNFPAIASSKAIPCITLTATDK